MTFWLRPLKLEEQYLTRMPDTHFDFIASSHTNKHRAIDPKDKSLAQGLLLFLMSLFAAIPTPIIFGRIIDSTCISWSFKCGGLGNCQLFDPILFRTYFHRSSAVFKVVAIIFEIMLWRLSTKLNLYGEDENQPKDSEEKLTPECEPLNK